MHLLGKDEAECVAQPDLDRAERHARTEHNPLDVFEGDEFLNTVSVHVLLPGDSSRGATIYLALTKRECQSQTVGGR